MKNLDRETASPSAHPTSLKDLVGAIASSAKVKNSLTTGEQLDLLIVCPNW